MNFHFHIVAPTPAATSTMLPKGHDGGVEGNAGKWLERRACT